MGIFQLLAQRIRPKTLGAMFTGLVEEVGSVLSIRTTKAGTQLQISAPRLAKDARTGDSVAVNGCCLTVSTRRAGKLAFDLLRETLNCTNLKTLRSGGFVNLERALATDGRVGGHFVQGHIDCVSPIVSFRKAEKDFRLEIEMPKRFARYIAPKGSIAINGISLTVAEILPKSFVVWIIPHTKKHTNLTRARAGDLVNLEFDILAKYVERMMARGKK